MIETQDVLFDEITGQDGDIGLITLNRPDVLNALNHSMINAMFSRLQQWATTPHIKAVVIRAVEGRAFCAGGDLRLTYDRARSDDPAMTDFFRDEYQLNRLIHHYPKPYIAFLDGITMGGGVGISIHGSHRIASERLLFAMPETGIGFFPDVGGTYFLPRLKGKFGYYLGLTGARLGCDDAVMLGIAQHKVMHDQLPALFNSFVNESFGDDVHTKVSELIGRFCIAVDESPLSVQQTIIDNCFSGETIDDMLSMLQQHQQHPICQQALSAIMKKSPTSLKVSLRAMHAGNQLDFDTCMRQEFRLASRFLEGHDFPEGIRAVILHKDQNPNWQPATLSAVTTQMVDKYFFPLTEELSI